MKKVSSKNVKHAGAKEETELKKLVSKAVSRESEVRQLLRKRVVELLSDAIANDERFESLHFPNETAFAASVIQDVCEKVGLNYASHSLENGKLSIIVSIYQ